MKSEPEQWEETFRTNITAQYFVTAAFLPLLAKGREVTPGYSTSIVNIASISGVMKGSSKYSIELLCSECPVSGLAREICNVVLDLREEVLIAKPA